MPRPCSICTHPEREAIDTALVRGEILRKLAVSFASSEAALFRHKRDHLAPRLAQAKREEDQAHADTLAGQVQRQDAAAASQATSLLQEVRALRSKAYAILLAAERSGDLRTALAGVREARGCLELLAEMEGQIDKRPVINLAISPEWLTVRAVIIHALAAFPDARVAVAEKLAALEASHGHRA